ncbi:MAG: GumC family protein [Alphaproteobacteria bacterium]
MVVATRADVDWGEIERRYRRGQSCNSIAKLFPTSRQTIMRRAKQYGWSRPGSDVDSDIGVAIPVTVDLEENATVSRRRTDVAPPAAVVAPVLDVSAPAPVEPPGAVAHAGREPENGAKDPAPVTQASPAMEQFEADARPSRNGEVMAAVSPAMAAKETVPGANGDAKPSVGLPELDPLDFFRILWRRKLTIVGTIFVVGMLTVFALSKVTPIFEAEALVLIGGSETTLSGLENVVQGLTADEPEILSQIEVLNSRRLAEQVIDEVGLYKLAEFNPSLRPKKPGLADRIMGLASMVPWLGVEVAAQAIDVVPPEIRAERQRTEIVDLYVKSLKTEPKQKSRVISVAFRSEKPELAARLANSLADTYIADQLETKFQAVEKLASWLDARLESLGGEVQRSEKAFEDFRAESGFSQGATVSLVVEQITQLNTQRSTARSLLAEAKSRLIIATRLEAQGNAGSLAQVLGSPTIQAQKARQTDLLRREAELAAQYGDRHPVMLKIRADLEQLASQIELEVNAVLLNIRSEADTAEVRVEALDGEIRALERKAQASSASEIELRALQREAKANSALFETFLGRFKQTSEQFGLERADARVISYAAAPLKPAAPKKMLILSVALVFSAVLGAAIAFVLEWTDRGFRSTLQLESVLGLPALGFVPRVAGMRRSGRRPEDLVQERPGSPFAEMLRSLHTSILLARTDPNQKVVLTTSAVPGEGKSTFVLSLARLVAGSGQRVLLIDCDVRRPSVHESMGVQNDRGLVDYLLDGLTLHDVVHKDETTGVDFITSGRLTHDSAALFRADRMKFLLDRVRGQYDLILLDSPPVLPLSDARILAGVADLCVFAVRWRNTGRDLATLALKQLRESRANMAGAVLTQVDVKQSAKQGYGDTWSYYGKFKQYYLDPDVR